MTVDKNNNNVKDDEFVAFADVDEATPDGETVAAAVSADTVRASDPVSVREGYRSSVDVLDDEEFLENGDDVVVAEDLDRAVLEQGPNAISLAWEVEGFYEDDGTAPSARSMRKNPPVLKVFEADGGESVEFTVTKEFARDFAEVFGDVATAYNGGKVRRMRRMSGPYFGSLPWYQKAWVWVTEHKLITVLGLIVAVSFVSSAVGALFR